MYEPLDAESPALPDAATDDASGRFSELLNQYKAFDMTYVPGAGTTVTEAASHVPLKKTLGRSRQGPK